MVLQNIGNKVTKYTGSYFTAVTLSSKTPYYPGHFFFFHLISLPTGLSWVNCEMLASVLIFDKQVYFPLTVLITCFSRGLDSSGQPHTWLVLGLFQTTQIDTTMDKTVKTELLMQITTKVFHYFFLYFYCLLFVPKVNDDKFAKPSI